MRRIDGVVTIFYRVAVKSMNMIFDKNLAGLYKSSSQKIRVMSESWIVENISCANCGGSLTRFPNNNPFADAYCHLCGEEYEVKCSRKHLGGRLVDGSYQWMMKKINNGKAPNLLHIKYKDRILEVLELTLIPRQFIVGDLIIKRPPLSFAARRKGWVGCFIDTGRLPQCAKIKIVDGGVAENSSTVIDRYNRVRFMQASSMDKRGWKMDVMRCIENLGQQEFALQELQKFIPLLSELHPENHHIPEKIRQQLQYLRDDGYIEFLKPGHYKLC